MELDFWRSHIFAFLLLGLLVIFLICASIAYHSKLDNFAIWCTNKAGEVLASFLTLAVASRQLAVRSSERAGSNGNGSATVAAADPATTH